MTNSAADERLRGGSLLSASDEARMREVRSDRWISYPRAEVILNQMERILAHPAQLADAELAEWCDSVLVPVFARGNALERAWALGASGLNGISR